MPTHIKNPSVPGASGGTIRLLGCPSPVTEDRTVVWVEGVLLMEKVVRAHWVGHVETSTLGIPL